MQIITLSTSQTYRFNRILIHFTLFLFFGHNNILAQNSPANLFKAASMQPGFLENRGQVRDVHGKAVDFVYYQANLGGQQVFITNYGLSIVLSNVKKVNYLNEKQSQGSNSKSVQDSVPVVNYDMERIDIVLRNASINPANIRTSASSHTTRFNFYFESFSDKNQDIQLQKEVLIKNVYPQVDWRIYIKEEVGKDPYLKYDFIVHPGGDPSQIQLRYSDNAIVEILEGEVSAKTKMGIIKEEKPYSYIAEDKSIVDVSWHIKKNTLKFNAGNYDKRQTLVIDPSIFWLTYLSSTSAVWMHQSITGSDVETDAVGNIFVQLSAASNVPFPTVNPGGGAFYQNQSSSPKGSMILCKFSPGGQMLWSTYFGNGVRGVVMTRDNTGNIYAIGTIYGGTPSDPNPSPSIPLLDNGGFYDGAIKKYFITKFSNSGSLIWSSYYANFDSYPTDMTFDNTGNVYVTGWSTSYNFPLANPGGGAYFITNAQYGWAQVLFVSQFNANNQLVWSTRIEGNDYDPYARICTDQAGNIYIGGHARSTNYPLVNAGGYFNSASTGSVLTRFNSARQMTWSTYFPAAFSLADLTTDNNNNLYVIADKRIFKFDANSQYVFEKSVTTTSMHFWRKIVYDAYNDQLQLLGVMNDAYWNFPTQNTACNGTFFNNGISPHTFSNATGPIFATINTNGDFTYRSLVDWVYEYYEYSEMAVDHKGDMIYLFGNQQNGYVAPNPQLTNPGNGAYFDPQCCYQSNGNLSALLLKLTSSELSVDLQFTPATGCSCNGVATATPQCGQSPFTYLWSNGATTATVSNLCPGNNWVKVSDANNLSRTTHFNLPYPPGSISGLSKSLINENCDRSNGAITVQTVQGGTSPYSYSLDGINYSSSPQFAGLTAGTYVVRVKDVNGCVFNDTSTLLRVQGPSAITFTSQKASCIANDGQLQVTQVTGGIGPYQYSLNASTPNTTGLFTGLAPASYQLVISDTAGCSLNQTVIVDKHTGATNVSFTTNNDHCDQAIGGVQVNNILGGTGPFTFSIDSILFGSGSPNTLVAGSYNLFVRDVNGCVLKTSPFLINNEVGPTSTTSVTEHAYCGKQVGTFEINTVQGGVAPYSYSLDGGTFTSARKFTSIPPGPHSVIIRDSYGCTYTQNFQVDYKVIAQFGITPSDTTVCYGETVALNLTGDVNRLHNINWNISASGNSASFRVNEEQPILVTATDDNNCTVTNNTIVKVKACNPPERCIAIPTAFTPNNDGKNDQVGPIINGCRIKSIRFRIYNRWGELVFETDRPGEGWNGIFRGISQDSGVYAFFCQYTTIDDVTMQQKGTIALIR